MKVIILKKEKLDLNRIIFAWDFFIIAEKVIDENTCYDSIVATANEDFAISCGYYEYTLYFLNGTSEKYKTCLLFNDDMVKIKILDFGIECILYLMLWHKLHNIIKRFHIIVFLLVIQKAII